MTFYTRLPRRTLSVSSLPLPHGSLTPETSVTPAETLLLRVTSGNSSTYRAERKPETDLGGWSLEVDPTPSTGPPPHRGRNPRRTSGPGVLRSVPLLPPDPRPAVDERLGRRVCDVAWTEGALSVPCGRTLAPQSAKRKWTLYLSSTRGITCT